MSETCPTVKIQADNEQGYVVINESDFNSKKHKKFAEKAAPAAPAETPEKPAEQSAPAAPEVPWANK